jgi:hypothetical protein
MKAVCVCVCVGHVCACVCVQECFVFVTHARAYACVVISKLGSLSQS